MGCRRIRYDDQEQYIQICFPKVGDLENNQPNDNWFNAKAKRIYNEGKAKWDKTFVSTKFNPHHMNSVIIEMWKRLLIGTDKTTQHSFEKTKLLPLRTPTVDFFWFYVCFIAAMHD